MTIDKIKEDVNQFLTKELEVPENKLHENARLKEDLDIGSLDLVDIVAYILQHYEFKVNREDIAKFKTLNDVYKYIQINTPL